MTALLQHGSTILTFAIVLAILVLVHELGHYIAARMFGIDVEEFGFGFPPRIVGWKKGKTIWSLNWIPLGGFVRIKGEDDPHATGPGNFAHQTAGVRSIVIAAGVFMNLVLASLLFAVGYTIGLPAIVEDIPKYAKARDFRVQVVELLPGFPAEKAGLRMGDIIETIDGAKLDKVESIQEYVNAHPGGVDVEVRRGKEHQSYDLVPQPSAESGRNVMGVALIETAIVSYPPHIALLRGVAATGYYVKEIFVSVGGLIKNLIFQQKSDVEFSGPVGIAVLTGRVAKLGFAYLVQFAGLLSVNLAVINILPIPALDGGRLLFIVIERFRGKAVRPKVEAMIHRIAFILLLLLVLLVTIKDINHYKDQILQALKSLVGVT